MPKEIPEKYPFQAFVWWKEGVSKTQIAQRLKVARGTVEKWSREGTPDKLTGGLPWKEAVEKERLDLVMAANAKAAEIGEQETLDFLKTARADMMKLHHAITARILAGEGEIKASDIEKIIMMFLRLDGQGTERVLWMHNIMRQVVRAVWMHVKDERIRTLIKSELIGIAAGEQEKLGPVPGSSDLPAPASIGQADWELDRAVPPADDVEELSIISEDNDE